MIRSINHVTFAVSDLPRSLDFYRDVLGAAVEARWETGAYLQLGEIWLCLSLDALVSVQARSDYSHIAFSVDSEALQRYETAFEQNGVRIWKDNKSEGESLYFLDPDGHKLELHVGTLQSRLEFMSACSKHVPDECGSAA